MLLVITYYWFNYTL